MSLEVEKMFHELEKAGLYWADSDAAASMFEESKKTVLADLMCEGAGPKTEREIRALSSKVYKQHIERMVAARKEANRAKVAYDSRKVLAEMRRSEEATRRAEAQLR